jgi:hypothetical protein
VPFGSKLKEVNLVVSDDHEGIKADGRRTGQSFYQGIPARP